MWLKPEMNEARRYLGDVRPRRRWGRGVTDVASPLENCVAMLVRVREVAQCRDHVAGHAAREDRAECGDARCDAELAETCC